MEFRPTIEAVGEAVDAFGVFVIAAGITWATVVWLGILLRRERDRDAYIDYRRAVGRAILLGLEILVAADIIRTVAVEPTLESVAVLAGIVLIRTFLSFTLEVELTGQWPWGKREGGTTG